MKILQIIQRPQLRGAEIFACQLAHELIVLGHEVDMACLFSDTDVLKHKFPDLNFISLEGDGSKRFFDFHAYRKLAALIGEKQYDVIQANASDTLKYGVFSKQLFRWKNPLIYRNASKMSDFIRNGIHKAFLNWLLRRTDFVISVSENCRTDLTTHFPFLEKRSVTIPIGTYLFDDVTPVQRDPGTSGPVFISIGSFVPEKNHPFVLEIFAEYFRKHGSGVLWLVGNGKLQQQLKEKVGTMGLESLIHFWGVRQDVVSILKAADVFMMPSRIEGLPGVILEALSCRVPVIASDVGGIPEVIHDRKNGFCVSGYDVGDYVRCMEVMTSDEKLRNEFTAAGYKTITENFLMTLISARFQKAYAEIAALR
jgi:L-malate glycosyltransferase